MTSWLTWDDEDMDDLTRDEILDIQQGSERGWGDDRRPSRWRWWYRLLKWLRVMK